MHFKCDRPNYLFVLSASLLLLKESLNVGLYVAIVQLRTGLINSIFFEAMMKEKAILKIDSHYLKNEYPLIPSTFILIERLYLFWEFLYSSILFCCLCIYIYESIIKTILKKKLVGDRYKPCRIIAINR